MRTDTLLGSLGIAAMLSGCAVSADGESVEESAGEKAQDFSYNPAWVWDDVNLSVCWTSAANENVTEKTWVRLAVEGAFEPFTNVEFTGWGSCNGGDADIKIAVDDQFYPAAAVGTGAGYDTGEDMRLNFYESNSDPRRRPVEEEAQCWPGSAQGSQPTTGDLGIKYWSTNRQRCIESIAVHEFLHAVGVLHEQDSPVNNQPSCFATGYVPNTVAFGYFDMVSASSYCNPSYRGETLLSPLDVSGLVMLYGSAADDQLWRGIGNIRDLTAADADALPFTMLSQNLSGNYQPLVGDYNGDGRDDIFWYLPGSGQDKVYFGSQWGSGFWHRNFTKSESAQTGVADFNGDGYDDIVWHTPSSGQNEVWYGASNGYFTTQAIASMPGNYAHKSFAGDFDGDGYGDIFWNGESGEDDRIWYGQAGGGFDMRTLGAAKGAKPFVGDFDGDGLDDIYFFYSANSFDFVAYGANRGQLTFTSVSHGGAADPTVADFNNDGKEDILWSQPGETESIWLFTARGQKTEVPTSSLLGNQNGDAVPVGGDFNGDGIGDVFWFSR